MKRIFAFRIDDITPDMDWERFYKLKSIFDAYGVKPLIGIVPDNRDSKLKRENPRPDFWEQMEELKRAGWVLSQHGCCHLYETKSSGIFHLRNQSEFAGLPYDTQKEKIERGQKILKEHGIETDIFFAPSNTYDRKTLKILKEAGFKYLPTGYTKYPYRYKGLLFIPAKHSEPDYDEGFVTIYLHPNTMTDDFMEEIRSFLEKHAEEVVAYDQLIRMAEENVHSLRARIEMPIYIAGKRTMRFIRKKLGGTRK